MKLASIFALLALMPAGLAASTPPELHSITVALCNGGKIRIPARPLPRDPDGCQGKACHAGCTRKRLARHV
jgi:hypothetical protein